jgi:hypothetical protein
MAELLRHGDAAPLRSSGRTAASPQQPAGGADSLRLAPASIWGEFHAA